MHLPIAAAGDGSIFYPETDGQPMSENTRQFRWIVTLAGNLTALFRDDEDVFVCGNQFWYPVEGEPDIRVAPDVYAVFGRPKGDRPSYKQWEEGGIPMTVLFEILSPSNTGLEMIDKLAFYEEYGAEEYYLYDPDTNNLRGYVRRGELLIRIRQMNGFVSPRLGIQFDLSGPELVVRYPDGRPFLTFEDLEVERLQAVQRAERAEQQASQAEQHAEQARRSAEQARHHAEQVRQSAEQADQRAARTATLAFKAMRQEATAEEVLELQGLLQKAAPRSDTSDAGQS